MVEPVGTAWPVLPLPSLFSYRRAERGARLNQIGHCLLWKDEGISKEAIGKYLSLRGT